MASSIQALLSKPVVDSESETAYIEVLKELLEEHYEMYPHTHPWEVASTPSASPSPEPESITQSASADSPEVEAEPVLSPIAAESPQASAIPQQPVQEPARKRKASSPPEDKDSRPNKSLKLDDVASPRQTEASSQNYKQAAAPKLTVCGPSENHDSKPIKSSKLDRSASPCQTIAISQKPKQEASQKRKACAPPEDHDDRSIKSRKLNPATTPPPQVEACSHKSEQKLSSPGKATGPAEKIERSAVLQNLKTAIIDDNASDGLEGPSSQISPTTPCAGPKTVVDDISTWSAPLAVDCDNWAVNDDTFARIETPAKQITYGSRGCQQTGWLRTVLTVSKDHLTSCRVFYKAVFFLKASTHPLAKGIPVGEVSAYRILKTNSSHFNSSSDWYTELLARFIDQKLDATLQETMCCMRAIYDKTSGKPRKNHTAPVDALTQGDMMYVSAVQIYTEYQRLGLLRPGMDDFEALLTRLPAMYAFEGPLVLVPAPLLAYDSDWAPEFYDKKGNLDTAKVTTCLIGVYEKCGYEMWVKGQPVKGVLYDVLGKMVTALDTRRDSVLIFEQAPPAPKKKKLVSGKVMKEREDARAAKKTPPPPPPPPSPSPPPRRGRLMSRKEKEEKTAHGATKPATDMKASPPLPSSPTTDTKTEKKTAPPPTATAQAQPAKSSFERMMEQANRAQEAERERLALLRSQPRPTPQSRYGRHGARAGSDLRAGRRGR